MKTILVIGMFLIGFTCFASGPALKDCDKVSATVSQTIELVSPALIPEAVVFYELPFAGTIPELGASLSSAELTGYSADIWHPPVLNSTMWLSSKKIKQTETGEYAIDIRARSWLTRYETETVINKVFHICWFDID